VSSKKKKTVPSAAEKTQESVEKAAVAAKAEPASVDTGKSVKTEQAEARPEPAFVGIDAVLAKVDKGMLEKADLVGAGDVIRALIQWGKSVDNKFNMVGGALQQLDKRLDTLPTEDSIADKFMEKVKAEREKALATRQNVQEQPQGQQQGGSGELGALLKVLGMGEGGGGGEAEKYFIQLGMETASLSNYMTKEMFKTVMPQAFEEWQRGFKRPGVGEAAKP